MIHRAKKKVQNKGNEFHIYDENVIYIPVRHLNAFCCVRYKIGSPRTVLNYHLKLEKDSDRFCWIGKI